MTDRKKHSHHIHSLTHRTVYSLVLSVSVLGLGTLSYHLLEGFSFLDAFYFSSMIATGQGPAPNIAVSTIGGKIFTCFYAFVSVGSLIASLGYLFGPFLGKLWHAGVLKLEDDLHIKR